MNYLKMCTADTIFKKGKYYYGTVDPTKFSDWIWLNRYTLIIESILQFCVKASNLDNINATDRKFLPAKISDLCLVDIDIDICKYNARAVVDIVSGIKVINFELYRGQNSGLKTQSIATGKVYVVEVLLTQENGRLT